jgi:hypothetical protein
MTQHSRKSQRRLRGIIITFVVIIAALAVTAAITLSKRSNSAGPLPVHLPPTPESYLGVYAHGVPDSYSGVTAFKSATGARPDVLMYYSGWYEPFQAKFAAQAAKNGEVPLVVMDPAKGPNAGISVARIASGKYDGYLSAYAEAVRAYRHPVIISFAHEMNGTWYPWGYTHTPPKTFVAAWKHVVTVFRALGAKNVTWLWTVNIINDTRKGRIPSPAPWWPGNSYVDWVGIDGYYLKPSWKFAPLFGPTITAVRTLTGRPILIAETGAVPDAGQPAKIADVFAGIRQYGLLGFVWFDSTNSIQQHFGLSAPAAIAAFRKGASTYKRPDA